VNELFGGLCVSGYCVVGYANDVSILIDGEFLNTDIS
jgi:hypothetical protein